MDPENITRRQGELNKIKKGLKDWEYGFFKTHKRKPTIKDIQERPKVERVYKDYHAKKKQLRLLSEECADSQSLSQPISFDSQQQHQQLDSTSQETKIFSPSSSSSSQPLSPSQKRRRGSHASVEYIRSPSHRLSRIKYLDQLELPTTSLDFGSSKSNTSSDTTATSARSAATDADSFWLTGSQGSSSRPTETSSGDTTTPDQEHGASLLDSGNTPSSFLLADNTTTTNITRSTSSNGSKKKKKKNAALEQKLFGHLIWKPRDTLSPALKAERDSSSQPTTPTTDSGMSLDSQTSPTPTDRSMDTMQEENSTTDDIPSVSTTTTTTTTTTMTTGKMVAGLNIDGLIITEHQHDPFRHFDPNLLTNLEDPDDFVMPGLFASARARSTVMAPMMEDDNGRYSRILEALRQGTLGEKRRDDNDVSDMDEDLKRFIDENTDTFADQADMAGQEEPPPPTYRKKFTQKRQTRLHKFKYVETTPSDM